MTDGMTRRVLGVVAALAISGQAPVATGFGATGFHCPPAGTVVVRDVGGGETYSVTYAGTDPAEPEGCLAPSNAKLTSYLFGMVNKHRYRAADFAAAYRKVLLGPPGTVAEFQYTEPGFGNFDERYENEAVETLQVGDETRPTIRISVTEKALGRGGFELNYHRWFDVQTGALMRQSSRLVSGTAPSNARGDENWTVTSIAVPK